MSTLLWILVSTLVGGVLSVAAAAAVALKASPARVPMFDLFRRTELREAALAIFHPLREPVTEIR